MIAMSASASFADRPGGELELELAIDLASPRRAPEVTPAEVLQASRGRTTGADGAARILGIAPSTLLKKLGVRRIEAGS
jgi:hypothetical protein